MTTTRQCTLALALAMFLTACASSTAPTVTPSGAWFGTDREGITFQLTVTEANGSVTGSMRLGGTNVVKYLTATGSFSAPILTLIVTEGGLRLPATVTGTVTSTTYDATLNGSGFVNDRVVFTRVTQ